MIVTSDVDSAGVPVHRREHDGGKWQRLDRYGAAGVSRT
jgi:hypothetical protein